MPGSHAKQRKAYIYSRKSLHVQFTQLNCIYGDLVMDAAKDKKQRKNILRFYRRKNTFRVLISFLMSSCSQHHEKFTEIS